MMFRCGAVVGGRIGDGKAVLDVGIYLNRVLHFRGFQGRFEPLFFLRREMRIDSGDADIDLSAYFGASKCGLSG